MFSKNKNIIFKIRRSKVTDYAALKKNLYSVLILHLLKPLFSAFHVLQALFFFVLVNDLYIGDPLEANKTHEICILQ